MEQVELQVAETEREEATSRWEHFFNVAGKGNLDKSGL